MSTSRRSRRSLAPAWRRCAGRFSRRSRARTRDGAKGRRKREREGQVDRIRRLCAALPSAFEKVSHGTPCFFVEQGKDCFAMFAEHHRDDGRLAVWVPRGAAAHRVKAEARAQAPQRHVGSQCQ